MKRLRNITGLSAMALLPATAMAQSEKPLNIICFVAEDTHTSYFECFGGPLSTTPTIDKLAAEGVRYTNFFSNHGVSAPSRVALITGMYPSSIGGNNMRTNTSRESHPEGTPYFMIPPAGVKCYPEYLREAGYFCTNNAKTDYQFPSPLTAWDENGNNAHWFDAPGEMPFFSIYNFNVCHESRVWANSKLPLTVDPSVVSVPPYYPDNEVVRGDIARVYSNLRLMDEQVAAKIKELEDAGELDRTIIVFYADNGGPLPRQKRSIHDMGMHVPLIIRYPDGYNAGMTDDRLCAFVDIPATIMSLAGLRPPIYMQGRAFAGKYETSEREYVYGARDRCDEKVDKMGAVRDKKFHYVRNYMPEKPLYFGVSYSMSIPMMKNMLELRDAGKLDKEQMGYFTAPRRTEEFYDVEKDPHNLNNLIDDPAYAVQIDRLRKAYDQWVYDYNDLWMMPESEIIKMFLVDGKQPTAEPPVVTVNDGRAMIFCNTPGASIAYRINGKGFNPKHWMLYTDPIELGVGDRLETVAVRAGYTDSRKVTFTK